MTSQHATYGVVHGPPTGEITRRSFMRRMLGVGLGVLSLEFIGATLYFLWPNLTEGLGARITLGTVEDITTAQPEWPLGLPLIYNQANLFFVNVPAARARVEANGPPPEGIPDPGAELGEDVPPAERSVLALYRKCPHLGCQIPQLCTQSQWFECLCHGSRYTVIGEHRAGPAERGMDRFPVEFADGAYIVDTSIIENGPPTGTVTFDERSNDAIPHCS